MSVYMSRVFRTSNSSFLLQSGTALQSEILRLREKTFLVSPGVGTPRICTQEETTLNQTTLNQSKKTRFEDKVGAMGVVSADTSLVKKQILERFFIDLVAGESVIKERAAATFNDLAGSNDVVPGEPHLLLPRKFRQNRAWMELTMKRRTNSKVKGFIVGRGRGGYSVAVAGFVTFLPLRKSNPRVLSDRFGVEKVNSKTRNVVLFQG